MDPISAIGFVSSALGIIELVTKGIASLTELRDRYRVADLKVSLLIGQLSTLNAALNQITRLLNDNLDVRHDTQLVQGLSTSLGSVEAVITILDEHLSPLQRQSANSLNTLGKVAFLWDESTLKDYLSLLNNQVNALNLLLTALQW